MSIEPTELRLPDGLAFLRYVAQTLEAARDEKALAHLRGELRDRLSTEQGIRAIIGMIHEWPRMTQAEMLAELVLQAMAANTVYGQRQPLTVGRAYRSVEEWKRDPWLPHRRQER